MPKISQSVLAGLANPGFSQGLFTAGANIGGIRGRALARQKEEAEKEAEKKRLQGITGGLFGIRDAVLAGEDTRDAIGSLAALGATPEQIAAAMESGRVALDRKEEKTKKENREEGYQALSALVSIPDFDIDKNPKDRKSFLQEATMFGFTPTEARSIYEAIRPTVKKGTPAKPSPVTLYDEASGQNMLYTLDRDEEGNVVKTMIGPAERKQEEPEEEDSNLDKKWGSDLFAETRERGREAERRASEFSRAAVEAADRAWWQKGELGKGMSATLSAVGMAGEATTFQRRLAEIRMSGVLEMLPPGVASDRDVQLALDASVDVNALSNEEAESYLKGIAKIAQAEADFYNAKRDFITDTKDANAVGFETWVARDAAEREIQNLKATVPDGMNEIAQNLAALGNENEATQAAVLADLNKRFPDEMKALLELDRTSQEWENFKGDRDFKRFN